MTPDEILDPILIPRPNGSEGLERVAAFIAATLQRAGAEVSLEPFSATPHGFQLVWSVALLLMLGTSAAILLRRYGMALALTLLTMTMLLVEFELLRSPVSGLLSATENNIVGSFPGHANGPTLIFCAHYDTAKGCPGANDNASGIASMLEIARHFTHTSPSCSIRFVALANEKPPFYGTEKSGSWIYAHRANHNCDKIRTAIILESLGSSSAMRRFEKCFKKHSRFPTETMVAQNFMPWVKWSDSSPFWLNGYHAFMISDTAQYRYPFYNSSRDTAEKLDYQCLTFITDGLTRAIEEYVKKR